MNTFEKKELKYAIETRFKIESTKSHEYKDECMAVLDKASFSELCRHFFNLGRTAGYNHAMQYVSC